VLADGDGDGFGAVLLSQPAAWSVPLAFVTMIGVSLLTASRVPTHTRRFMVRLHAPETLQLDRGPM
jgi:Na+(H+)/acetate symporter ActP